MKNTFTKLLTYVLAGILCLTSFGMFGQVFAEENEEASVGETAVEETVTEEAPEVVEEQPEEVVVEAPVEEIPVVEETAAPEVTEEATETPTVEETVEPEATEEALEEETPEAEEEPEVEEEVEPLTWNLPSEEMLQWSAVEEATEIDLVEALEVKAFDADDNTVVVTVKDNGGLDLTAPGTYTITFAATNPENEVEETQSVALTINSEELAEEMDTPYCKIENILANGVDGINDCYRNDPDKFLSGGVAVNGDSSSVFMGASDGHKYVSSGSTTQIVISSDYVPNNPHYFALYTQPKPENESLTIDESTGVLTIGAFDGYIAQGQREPYFFVGYVDDNGYLAYNEYQVCRPVVIHTVIVGENGSVKQSGTLALGGGSGSTDQPWAECVPSPNGGCLPTTTMGHFAINAKIQGGESKNYATTLVDGTSVYSLKASPESGYTIDKVLLNGVDITNDYLSNGSVQLTYNGRNYTWYGTANTVEVTFKQYVEPTPTPTATPAATPTPTATPTATPAATPTPTATPNPGRSCQDDGYPAGYYWNGTACVIDHTPTPTDRPVVVVPTARPTTPSPKPTVTPSASANTTLTASPNPTASGTPSVAYNSNTDDAAKPEYGYTTASWSLINFILATIGLVLGIVHVASKNNKEEVEDGIETQYSRSFTLKVITALLGAAGVIVFILTSNLSAQMVLVDKYSVIMAVIACASGVTFLLGRQWKEVNRNNA